MLRHLDPSLLALAAAALGGTCIGLSVAASRARRRIARARRDGRRGEARALRLLRRAGYRVVEVQPAAELAVRVDGGLERFVVRADAIAVRGWRRYVVEVKTGAAASVAYPPTRRQLLEYARVFRCRDLLLVDADRGRIHRVRFA